MKRYIPRAIAASQILSIALSLGAFALAIAAARELWTKRTGTELKSWLHPVFELISRAHYEPWMLPGGVVAALVGLIFIIVAVKPRPRTHVPLAAAPNFWIRNVNIARLCTATAERVPGVSKASTYASPRTVIVTVTGSDHHGDLAARVSDSIEPIVGLLESPRRVNVKFVSSIEERQ